MKLNKNYTLHDICGEHVAIFMGETGGNHMLSLNNSAASLWEALADKDFTLEEMVHHLTTRYEIDADTARADAQELVQQWKQAGVIVTE